MYPSGEMITPLPRPCSMRFCGCDGIELTAELWPTERTARTKELLHVGHAFVLALLRVALRHDRDVHDRRCNSCRQRFHGAVEREQAATLLSSSAAAAGAGAAAAFADFVN
jgi:hypothetical protein